MGGSKSWESPIKLQENRWVLSRFEAELQRWEGCKEIQWHSEEVLGCLEEH